MEREKILIVEDDLHYREYIHHALEEERYSVASVACAEKALDYLKIKKFDLIISDIRMCRISGIDLLKQVRAAHKDQKIILITAYGDAQLRMEALEKGALAYMEKPIELNELIRTVQQYLKHP